MIPHQFSQKEDIEISGFLAATIAWGNRKSIINNATKMMALMDHAPYDFIINHQKSDLERFEGFVHRTFNADDLRYFIKALQHIYQEHQGLEQLFSQYANPESLQGAIHHFKQVFFLYRINSARKKTRVRSFKRFCCKTAQYVFALDGTIK